MQEKDKKDERFEKQLSDIINENEKERTDKHKFVLLKGFERLNKKLNKYNPNKDKGECSADVDGFKKPLSYLKQKYDELEDKEISPVKTKKETETDEKLSEILELLKEVNESNPKISNVKNQKSNILESFVSDQMENSVANNEQNQIKEEENEIKCQENINNSQLNPTSNNNGLKQNNLDSKLLDTPNSLNKELNTWLNLLYQKGKYIHDKSKKSKKRKFKSVKKLKSVLCTDNFNRLTYKEKVLYKKLMTPKIAKICAKLKLRQKMKGKNVFLSSSNEVDYFMNKVNKRLLKLSNYDLELN